MRVKGPSEIRLSKNHYNVQCINNNFNLTVNFPYLAYLCVPYSSVPTRLEAESSAEKRPVRGQKDDVIALDF